MEGPVGGGEPIRAEGLHTDEGEHHDRRIPVLKKVKDKVKKIKDSIKKKQHHENDHGSGSNATTDDDDDVEEEEQNPEIHGAPIYESEAIQDVGLVHAIEDIEEDPGAPDRRTSIPESEPEPGLIKSFHAMSVSSDQPKKDEDQKKSSPLPTSFDMDEDLGAPMSQTATSTCSPGSYQTIVTGGPEPGVIRSSTEEKHEEEEEEKLDPHHKDQSYKEKISAAAATTEKATAIQDTVVSATTGGSSSTSSTEEDVGKGKQKQQDKGVSLREYLAEKLSPGEEDKTLSEVISGSVTALTKKKESDAASVLVEDEKKEEVEHQGVMGKIKGAVTSLLGESDAASVLVEDEKKEEVEHQGVMGKMKGAVTSLLGESDAASVLVEDEKKEEVEHQGVMGKIKGAVTSLLGGGGEPKKLQESSN